MVELVLGEVWCKELPVCFDVRKFGFCLHYHPRLVVDPITFQVNTVMSSPRLMYPPSTVCFLAVVSVCLCYKLTVVCVVSVINQNI